jgi:hypothetical protein
MLGGGVGDCGGVLFSHVSLRYMSARLRMRVEGGGNSFGLPICLSAISMCRARLGLCGGRLECVAVLRRLRVRCSPRYSGGRALSSRREGGRVTSRSGGWALYARLACSAGSGCAGGSVAMGLGGTRGAVHVGSTVRSVFGSMPPRSFIFAAACMMGRRSSHAVRLKWSPFSECSGSAAAMRSMVGAVRSFSHILGLTPWHVLRNDWSISAARARR